MSIEKLTEKQRAWIDYYKQGYNALESARLAGYKAKDRHSLENIGSENLGKLGRYLGVREFTMDKTRIADMEEINAFWTETMRDEAESRVNRLKASELRARAMGAFVDNLKVDGQSPAVVILSGDTEIKD
jgi:phage terminase small subunit